jgi:ganglioside-induced differentiation-associated protein 1
VEVVSPLIGEEARGLAGLHLFHYGLSNCSQKVRIVLAEKGLGWTNHWVDLAKGEHRTETYRRINPNCVVPTLVHDGTILIESSDIMEYLDERFPDPPLRPSNERDLARMRQWVARQESIQRSLEVLSREFLFVVLDDRRVDHPSHSSIAGAVRGVEEALAELDRHLAGRTWLVGNALSLADVAWMVDVHRFRLMHFPMSRHAGVRAWYRRVRRLTSFQQAVLAYEPPTLRRRLAAYVCRRWLLRSHLGAAKWRNARLLADA